MNARAPLWQLAGFIVFLVASGCDNVPRTYMMLCENDEECRREDMVCADVAGAFRCTMPCDRDTDCPADCEDHGECREGLCVNVECS
jgi:hypothetical protein